MRFVLILAATFLFPLLAASSPAVPTAPDTPPGQDAPRAPLTFVAGPGASSCDDVGVSLSQPTLLEMTCNTGEIRPGVKSSGCTLNWLMTDGTDWYIGTAGHCGGVGKTYHVSGLGAIGTTMFREFQGADILNLRDWGLVRIDPAQVANVQASMYRWGGPLDIAGTVRAPIPGEQALMYGNGQGLGEEDATKGRVWQVLAPLGDTAYALAGSVGKGDSGSPVRAASGQAIGIAVAGGGLTTGDNDDYPWNNCALIQNAAGVPGLCAQAQAFCAETDGACDGAWHDGNIAPLVVITRMDAAIAAFEAHLGHPIWVVAGDLPGVGLPP